METLVLMHSIVLEGYLSEEAQYCGGEGPVLMTQRGTIGSGGGGAGRILPSLPLISYQLAHHHLIKVPRNKDINIVNVIASNDCVAILPLIS